jgi:hypothetical protein
LFGDFFDEFKKKNDDNEIDQENIIKLIDKIIL